MLDPDQLRNFLHVVDLGSLSKAAHLAHISQPALSRQIRLLEEVLGCELFARTGRGMRATSAARRLEARARPLLAQLDGLEQSFVNAPVAGPLTLAVTPSVGMSWTAARVQKFRARHPAVQLRVVVTLSGPMSEAVASGRYDLGVLYSPLPAIVLTTKALWREETYFICHRSDERAQAQSVGCRHVLQSPLILPSSPHGIRALLEEQAREHSTPLNTAVEVDSLQLAMELVRQGAGNMVLTERALPDLAARQLVAVPIRRPTLVRAAHLAASEAALQRPAVQAMWEFITPEL